MGEVHGRHTAASELALDPVAARTPACRSIVLPVLLLLVLPVPLCFAVLVFVARRRGRGYAVTRAARSLTAPDSCSCSGAAMRPALIAAIVSCWSCCARHTGATGRPAHGGQRRCAPQCVGEHASNTGRRRRSAFGLAAARAQAERGQAAAPTSRRLVRMFLRCKLQRSLPDSLQMTLLDRDTPLDEVLTLGRSFATFESSGKHARKPALAHLDLRVSRSNMRRDGTRQTSLEIEQQPRGAWDRRPVAGRRSRD